MPADEQMTTDTQQEPRALVRRTFWFVVAALWVVPLTFVALVVAATLLGGRPSKVLREVTLGMTAEDVRRRVGAPSETFDDAVSWRWLAAKTKQCGANPPVATAWLYSRILQDDSMVFFDANQRVLCVHESGEIIFIRSVD